MSSIGTGYDLSASQFSPDGRVFQVDYAGKAVENSGTAIGLRGSDGIVFAVEKIVTSKLYEKSSGTRIFKINKGITMTFAGVITDGRQLIDIARQESNNYNEQYRKEIPLKELTDRLSSYMHAYTLFSAVRPFGVAIMLASWSEINGAELYMIEPSGVSCGYFGCAIGKAKQNAKNEIEKLIIPDALQSCEQLLNDAAKIIYLCHDQSKDKEFTLELSFIKFEIQNGVKERIHKILDFEDQIYLNAISAGQSANEEDGED